MKFFVTMGLSLALSSHLYAQGSQVNSNSSATKPVNAGVDTPAQTPENNAPTNGDASAPVNSPEAKPEILPLTVDATSKQDFVYLAIEDGKLVPVAQDKNWVFGVRRYIFQTATGSNGESHVGGSYVAAGAGFADFASCKDLEFSPDEVISMLGYTISANRLITTEWYDYDDTGAVAPLDKFFAVKVDEQCVKFKINSYAAGLYEIDYSILPE